MIEHGLKSTIICVSFQIAIVKFNSLSRSSVFIIINGMKWNCVTYIQLCFKISADKLNIHMKMVLRQAGTWDLGLLLHCLHLDKCLLSSRIQSF